MSRKHIFQVLFCIAFFAMTSTTALAGFNIADCVGTWYAHKIVSGDVPPPPPQPDDDDPRWGYGTIIIQSNGTYTYTFTSPTSSNETGSGTVQIDVNGVVKFDNTSKTHGAMSDNKRQIVLVDWQNSSDGNGFLILTKKAAGTFATQDLAGTWHGHQVVTGDAPVDDPRCGHGTATVNNAGAFNWTFTKLASPPSSPETGSGTFQISSNGIVTMIKVPPASGVNHGAMNDAKDQIVLIDGQDDMGGHGFLVLTKRDGVTFTKADLAGDWYAHQVVSGDAPADDPRWGYGTIKVDNSGNASYVFTSPSSANETGQATMQITGNGIVRIDNSILTHGVMNDMKDQIVLVDNTSQNGGNGLLVMTKRADGIKTNIVPSVNLLLDK